ncbi:Protein kinase domain containing protein [Coccidioides posadasii C735 delta SOWgp]|uniref:Protein kinase domain containing protein n=1 Tax=Coccidioides posadasii (strain C735) TaxID=222929 RepID=C5PBV8_COCP7|nr:Protein kinase domain containing protein [Coccidioides posadasii C735 delta SOWgp]EER25435.1 Protein kinase domain containing protein [Coccidioides posadasii C735 delta SOWgp]|eukprot:XP_003067580.1 Protein kinase domain containing protein [Coccidioides posadasii C735 delta SOWgp]
MPGKDALKMASALNELIGMSGCRYRFKELIQERPHIGRVWLATSGQDQVILKDIPTNIFSNFNEIIRPKLRESPYIRLPLDTIVDQRIFVYKYLTDDFLSLIRKQIAMRERKKVLKACLRGIAELHEQDVVHLDIKADNIMVNCRTAGNRGDRESSDATIVKQVQVTDLENAAYLPKGRCIKGMLAGNDNWRSPEAHFRGELNKPTDMFSFGVVCIYSELGRVIFGPDDDFKKHEAQGALPSMIRLQRQVSYFGDKDGLNGLMKHLGDDERNCQILGMLWEDRFEDYIPYKPFSEWQDVSDEVFKDLIRGLMNLDPAKRITARQALKHPWFADV